MKFSIKCKNKLNIYDLKFSMKVKHNRSRITWKMWIWSHVMINHTNRTHNLHVTIDLFFTFLNKKFISFWKWLICLHKYIMNMAWFRMNLMKIKYSKIFIKHYNQHLINIVRTRCNYNIKSQNNCWRQWKIIHPLFWITTINFI